MSLTIQRHTNQSRQFYRLLGPFLARRDVADEVGGPIWDDDGKIWWVALTDGQVAGFCAAVDPGAGKPVSLRSAYVRPPLRRGGLYRRLHTERVAWFPGRQFRATCTAASLPLLLGEGFEVVRERGRFTQVRRG